jgi:hypothetical protein
LLLYEFAYFVERSLVFLQQLQERLAGDGFFILSDIFRYFMHILALRPTQPPRLYGTLPHKK